MPHRHAISGRLLILHRASCPGTRRKRPKLMRLSVADAPPHACPSPGCGGSAAHGQRWCAACKEARLGERRARQRPATRLYGSAAWKRIRRAVLAEQPICCMCKRAASTDCDHIDGDYRNTSRSNLQGLCHSCHSRKTSMEDGGFGVGRKERR